MQQTKNHTITFLMLQNNQFLYKYVRAATITIWGFEKVVFIRTLIT